MTYIFYGLGAVGGAMAARLSLTGHEVAGIARGAQLEAVRTKGLTLRTPDKTETAKFTCVGDPTELDIGKDDVIFLTMKGQDTAPALERLRAAGVKNQPIICAQNGVANERMALRFFPNVYGLLVMMPATFMVPGEVAAFGKPKHGIFEIGRYPEGSDQIVAETCDALNDAGFAAFDNSEVMKSKHGKLILNLSNIIGAALGTEARNGKFADMVTSEANAVFEKAGIAHADVGAKNPKRDENMRLAPIEGVERVGSSSAQSLARSAGSIETDYLNGEIALLGRLHGVPVPANQYFCDLAHKMISERLAPGSVSLEEVEQALASLS